MGKGAPRGTDTAGMTLIELLMALSLMAILAITAITTITDTDADARHRTTVDSMNQIKMALIGDPNATENGVRSNFGYVGDVGAMPADADGLAALITRPATVLPFGPDTATRLGAGWKGPYLRSQGLNAAGTKDGWFNALAYTSVSPASITSYGADGAAGGTGWSADIDMDIPDTDWKGTVFGFVSDTGGPYTSPLSVVINYPDGTGVITNTTYSVSDGSGYFTFSDIPFGRRSLSLVLASKTIGPILITVDSPQYEVNTSLIDVSRY